MRFRILLAAISVFGICLMSFAAQPDVSGSPVLFVKGLLMLQLEQKDGLHIVVPDAPGHKAAITFVMQDGQRHSIPFKGHNVIQMTGAAESTAVVKVPELIRMKELYGNNFTARVDRSPNSVTIPWSSIRMVSTEKVTDARYTFERSDNGYEIQTFRPRNIAESLRIDLSSSGKLESGLAKGHVELSQVKEIRIEQVPTGMSGMSGMDMYAYHFHHYLHYVDRFDIEKFDVQPRKVSGAVSFAPRVGHSFWFGDVLCCPVAIN